MKNFYEEFKDKKKSELNEDFIVACQKGNLDKIDYLINSPELRFNVNPHYQKGIALNIAISHNHIDIIKYLSDPKKIKKTFDIKRYSIAFLTLACKEKDYEWLEELLPITDYSVSDLTNDCCMSGNVDMVKYLLNSPTWGKKITIDDGLLNNACSGGNVELIDYLLKSQWKDNFDIHNDYDLPFLNCCEAAEFDTIKYFIFNLHIEKSSYIEEYLNDEPDQFNKDVIELFNKRDLNNSLTEILVENKENKRKNKI